MKPISEQEIEVLENQFKELDRKIAKATFLMKIIKYASCFLCGSLAYVLFKLVQALLK